MSLHKTLAALALVLAAAPARGEKLDKDAKKWLEDVASLILPDEEKIYKELKSEDRAEFQKIFWARRDPDIETPENEFQEQYVRVKAAADKRFRVPGSLGSQTDCGKLLILLGEPATVKEQDDAAQSLRKPEIWTYKGARFVGGQAEIALDSDCRIPQAARSADQLNRMAESKIVHPNLDYRVRQGRLTKLDDLKPKPSPGQALLKAPRQDFPLETRAHFLRTQDGGTVLVGLVKGRDISCERGLTMATFTAVQPGMSMEQVNGLLGKQGELGGQSAAAGANILTYSWKNPDGSAMLGTFQDGKLVQKTQSGLGSLPVPTCVSVVAHALGEDGKVVAVMEQATGADLRPDGSFVTSYRLALRPGKYTLTAGAVDPKTGKGSVATMPVETPDLNKGELSMASLMIVDRVEEAPSIPEQHPFAAFALGSNLLVPHFGETLTSSDAPSFFYQFYDAQVDVATGKRSATATLSILKEGKPLASAGSETYEGLVGANLVGPVPLEKYGKGRFTAQLKVVDNVAKKDYMQEVGFEVK